MYRQIVYAATLLAALALGSHAGRAGGTAPSQNLVKGRVLLSNGQPLPGGELHLTYEGNKEEVIAINPDGTFCRKGVLRGKARVWLRNDNLPKGNKPYVLDAELPPAAQQRLKQILSKTSPKNMPRWVPLPARYQAAQTTPWTWEIREGMNQREWVVEAEKD
jgi:hypothetical protein